LFFRRSFVAPAQRLLVSYVLEKDKNDSCSHSVRESNYRDFVGLSRNVSVHNYARILVMIPLEVVNAVYNIHTHTLFLVISQVVNANGSPSASYL